MPLIIAAWPCRVARLHLGCRTESSWPAVPFVVGADASVGDGGISEGCEGGVAGGLRMPGRDEECNVAVMGR